MRSVDTVRAIASMPALEQLALPLVQDGVPDRSVLEEVGPGT